MLCLSTEVLPHFTKGDIRFLTLRGRGDKPREQKIGFVNDLCRKISATYFIVREKNKRTTGFHFHALIKANKKITKSWYKKGVHMNLLHVGKPWKNRPPKPYMYPGQREAEEKKKDDEYLATLSADEYNYEMKSREDAMEERCARARALARLSEEDQYLVSQTGKLMSEYRFEREDLARILNYMKKEMHMPMQYTDYVWSCRGKQVRLPGT